MPESRANRHKSQPKLQKRLKSLPNSFKILEKIVKKIRESDKPTNPETLIP